MIRSNLTSKRAIVAEQPSLTTSQDLGGHCEALYRRIRTLSPQRGPGACCIGLTGCRRKSGVTTLAAGLAQTVALGGGRALLIDANLNYPAVARKFSVNPVTGFVEFFASLCPREEAVCATAYPGLDVMPAGSKRTPARFSPAAVKAAFESCAADYDLIVVDLPTAIDTSLCFDIAATLDGVLIVLEAERVPGDAAGRAKKQLTNAGANLLGVVLNKRPYHIPNWLY